MTATAASHARWSLDDGRHEHVVFLVEGMRCAGCARGIEAAVRALPDVESVAVNLATARVSVDWRGAGSTGLAQILAAVERGGFRPVPLAGDAASAQFQAERRAALKRVGFASLGMMQAMMYLAALYGVSDIDASMATLMRVTGMIIVTPVLFYSGAPYLVGAWRDVTNRRLGMDVPVALALLLAWLPSVVNTFRGTGDVYFDSVGMFIFFLSLGRFAEMSVRHRGLTSAEALARSLPAQVARLRADGSQERVAATELRAGDRFLAPSGAVVAVDATLAPELRPDTVALLDESLLTGESTAAHRRGVERIRGGSVNVGAPLTLVAQAAVGDSTLASTVRLLERAQSERPRLARVADRAASGFVAAILGLAALTAAGWIHHDAARAFPAVLAVLVVTCPCALSLATPAALTAAATRLARLGVLIAHADAVEHLARIDTVVLDKTGTLTESGGAVLDVRLFGGLDRASALATAAALERRSSHPLAAALRAHEMAGIVAQDLREEAGQGVEGVIGGTVWRLGRRRWAERCAEAGVVRALPTGDDATTWLAGPAGLVAAIDIGAPLRSGARATVDALRALGLDVIIASGDGEVAVRQAARALGIERALARCTPARKIALVRELRRDGRRVFAVGDGINDGPVLAAADVSCAMGTGSAIAHCAADLLLVHDGLEQLPRAIVTARESLRVMRQNLGWSLGYNLAAVPLAALGLVAPWLAALGMSLSSLGVVLNARRLAGRTP
ncbi:MAG TPA: cation-translocating P-type ATPase [Steroidobacteraceae bacterium]|nr:cation-translocating P-type ATPase [Steroidobacteraceae bacterium]